MGTNSRRIFGPTKRFGFAAIVIFQTYWNGDEAHEVGSKLIRWCKNPPSRHKVGHLNVIDPTFDMLQFNFPALFYLTVFKHDLEKTSRNVSLYLRSSFAVFQFDVLEFDNNY